MPRTKRPGRTIVDRTGVTAWIDRRHCRAIKHYAVEHDTTVSRLVADLITRHLVPLVDSKKEAS